MACDSSDSLPWYCPGRILMGFAREGSNPSLVNILLLSPTHEVDLRVLSFVSYPWITAFWVRDQCLPW